MATSARLIPTRIEATGSPRQPPALNDELLEEIFLRIASPADLARASTACVSFRRLIADPAFLRRYRSLHPPPLLGFLCSSNSFRFKPVEAPNAPAARALDRAADFSFDYVPLDRGLRWYIGDVRGGRVLLVSLTAFGSPLPACCRPHLAVCDPLSRGYLLLPPVPGDLLASVQMQQVHLSYLEAFLAPCGEEEDDTSFRVICWVECWVPCSISVVFVFSSASGLWSVGASTSWDALSLNVPGAGWPSLSRARSADGWLYWKVLSRNKLLKLDINRMEFSTIDLPPGHENRDVVIVEAGEGRTVMVSHISSETFMCYAIRQNEGQNANEWKMENKILLPIYLKCRLMGAAGGYIFLLDRYRDDGVHVSLHVKTLNIETSCWKGFYLCLSYPYFGFAPSMSPRRI